MELRRRRRLPLEGTVRDLEAVAAHSPAPDEIHERDAAQQGVLEALERLPRGEREAVTLYYLEDQGVEAVARFLGISSNAVKTRLHRARQKLRKEMTTMAKKTLSRKKLGPEFADRIEIRQFSDLARLTDDELRALAERPMKPLALAYALAGDDPVAEKLRTRILELLPDVARQRLAVNIEFYSKYRDPLDEHREAVLSATRKLQEEGAVRPPPPRKRPYPVGSIQVERFSHIAALTDYEIYQLLCETQTKDAAVALTGSKDRTGERPGSSEEVKTRLMVNVSERVSRFFEIERSRRKITPDEIAEAQRGMVRTVHRLQSNGEVRPGVTPTTKARVDLREFGDLAHLTDEELQLLLREVDARVLSGALKGRGKAIREVEGRIMQNMSDFAQECIREEMALTRFTRADIDSGQQEVLATARKLQVLGSIRPASRRPTARQYDKAVAEAAQGQIDHWRHSDRWTPRNGRHLIPYLASMGRNGNLEEAAEGISDPVYERAIALLAEGASRGKMTRQLERVAEEEVDRITREYRRAIAGFAAMADGQESRKVGEQMRRL
jgi:predicted DNA-binding protein YlxM (UPF0122 family)